MIEIFDRSKHRPVPCGLVSTLRTLDIGESIIVSEAKKSSIHPAAKRAGVPKANWVHEAILFALEADEAPTKPTPQAIRDATPRRAGNGRIVMPRGRVFEPR